MQIKLVLRGVGDVETSKSVAFDVLLIGFADLGESFILSYHRRPDPRA